MAGHTSEKRWRETRDPVTGQIYEGISERAAAIARDLVTTLTLVEEGYQELLEIYQYAGNTDQGLAELLFKEDIALRESPNNVVSAEEIAKCADLIAAMQAAHQLYQCGTNVAVTQSDRFALLRRMSLSSG